MANAPHVAVLGAGIQGVCAALELARRGCAVDLYDRAASPLTAASRWNEGKIHLGFLFARDDPERTARTMMLGSLHFWDRLSRWLDRGDLEAALSEPFEYLVHAASLVEVEAIEGHFRAVARLYRELREASGKRYLGEASAFAFERLGRQQVEARFDGAPVLAVYRTAERALDPAKIATRLSAAVAAEPRIRFLGGHAVESVERRATGRLVVKNAAVGGVGYDQVINALWSDRLRVDATMGLRCTRKWLFRYKLAIHASAAAVPADLSSTTVVLGPFGDVVNFGDGRLYLSWYPVCRIGSSSALAPPDWSSTLDAESRRAVFEQTLDALTAIIPALRSVDLSAAQVEVAGGVIFAWGEADITDLTSELHQRFDIGVRSRENYHSIDTGKYCLAPWLAVEAADRIRPLA